MIISSSPINLFCRKCCEIYGPSVYVIHMCIFCGLHVTLITTGLRLFIQRITSFVSTCDAWCIHVILLLLVIRSFWSRSTKAWWLKGLETWQWRSSWESPYYLTFQEIILWCFLFWCHTILSWFICGRIASFPPKN